MASQIEIPTEDWLRELGNYAEKIEAGLDKGMKNIGATLLRASKALAPTRGRTTQKDGSPSQATGRLVRSIKTVIKKEQGKTTIDHGIGTPVGGKRLVYAKIRDVGGTIRPVRAKKLAWPVADELFTKAGISGIRARDVVQNPQRFGFDRVSFTKRSILGWRGDDEHPVRLFARASKVTQEGTGYIQKPFKDMREGAGMKILREAVQRELG